VTDLEREELLLLERARRAHEPSHLDVARVLQKTRVAIAAGAVVTGAAVGVGFWAKHGASLSALLQGSVLPKLLIALSIAGAGAAGYGIGYQQARKHASLERGSAQNVRNGGPGMELPGAPASSAPAALIVDPGRPNAVAATIEPAAVEEPSTDLGAKPHASSARRRPANTTVDGVPAAEATLLEQPNDTLAAPASLSAELTALRRVERALREREPGRALALLDRLDAQVPEGRLLEERAAARTMARCAVSQLKGETRDAMQSVLEFSRSYPASVYFERVRGTCLSKPTDLPAR
jgi:hypothetical protein